MVHNADGKVQPIFLTFLKLYVLRFEIPFSDPIMTSIGENFRLYAILYDMLYDISWAWFYYFFNSSILYQAETLVIM